MLALALAGLLFLPGCASMLERSYVSATAHVDYSVTTEDASILRAETYQGLVNSILYFVNERADSGTIRLYNYTGDVEADLANACSEVCREDPLSAYSVRSIRYDSTRILTYYEVELTIQYSRTADEVAALREISGVSALRDELAAMVDRQESRLTLLVSYYSDSADQIFELLSLALYARPELYLFPGSQFEYTISIYPETGSRRIIEISIDNWVGSSHTTEGELNAYTRQLEEATRQLLEANPPTGVVYTVEDLAAILRSASGGYDYYNSAANALSVLTGGTSAETGYLLAMEYLCQQCGIEVLPVKGGASLWLIAATEDGYRHLLPQDLFPVIPEEGADPEEPQPLPLYTDGELEALGYYEWNRSLYPACESRIQTPAE